MYLYFDVNGNLKEIVQLPIREGDVQSDKIYIFVSPTTDNLQGTVYKMQATYAKAKISFADLNDNNLNHSGTPAEMSKVNVEIPFNNNRDLYFFKYGYKYECFSVTLPTEATVSSGVVVASAYLYNIGSATQKALNKFSFNVEASVGVKLDSTMTQSQYSYLYNLIGNLENYVPYENATQDLDMGGYGVIGQGYIAKYCQFDTYDVLNTIYYADCIVTIANWTPDDVSGVTYNLPLDEHAQGNYTLATREWTATQLPQKKIVGFFYTSAFTQTEDGNYVATDITISDFMEGSNLIIITWDNCFAICPIPQNGPGRVVAAMWNANGEAQTIRIRYELKANNTKLDISLQGGFTPPANHSAIVINYKITQS